MDFYHYSSKPFKFDPNYRLGCASEALYLLFYKPIGLWVTCKSSKDDYDWKEWCEDQEFCLENLKTKNQVFLKEDFNLLHLKTPQDMANFHQNEKIENVVYSPRLKKEMKERWKSLDELKKIHNILPPFPDLAPWECINWPSIIQRYDGILISPYMPKFRQWMWYNGWDCSSGCFWNFQKIEKIEVVE